MSTLNMFDASQNLWQITNHTLNGTSVKTGIILIDNKSYVCISN